VLEVFLKGVLAHMAWSDGRDGSLVNHRLAWFLLCHGSGISIDCFSLICLYEDSKKRMRGCFGRYMEWFLFQGSRAGRHGSCIPFDSFASLHNPELPRQRQLGGDWPAKVNQVLVPETLACSSHVITRFSNHDRTRSFHLKPSTSNGISTRRFEIFDAEYGQRGCGCLRLTEMRYRVRSPRLDG
jgi:hypothetical protein